MIITRLEECKSQFKIYLDDEYAFTLLPKELQEYNLKEGACITEELYDELVWKVLCPRAKQKAVAILKYMDRCEQELKRKLLETGFTGDVIQEAINYVKNYDYLNDERFAAAYIRSRMTRKSKLMLQSELLQKGVDKGIILSALEQQYSDNEHEEDVELTAIKKAIYKKTKFPEDLSSEDKQKLIASLYRRGFDMAKIKMLLPY